MRTIILSVLCMAFSSIINADDREFCQNIQQKYSQTGYWSRYCGPEPGKDFISEMKKDCRQTTRQIEARPGASWNSEIGWAFEDQCEALNKTGL